MRACCRAPLSPLANERTTYYYLDCHLREIVTATLLGRLLRLLGRYKLLGLLLGLLHQLSRRQPRHAGSQCGTL